MPTLTQIFGLNASVLTATASVTASASDPVLVIKFSDLIESGFDNTDAAQEPNPWFGALVDRYAQFSATTAGQSEANNIVCSAPDANSFITILSRNGEQKIELPYQLIFYAPYSGPTRFDPDDLA